MKTCKICKIKYEPWRSTQPTCGNYDCNVAFAISVADKARIAKARKDAKAHKEAKAKAKTRSQWIKEAQALVNKYVRLRDIAAGHPCISCGRQHKGQWHAGHYRSVGSAPHLRFDVDRNIMLQCSACNVHLSGNLILFRTGLIKRIGIKKVEELESDQSVKKYTIDDLKEIIRMYKEKIKKID